jgi:hypothetical protein
MFFALFVYLFGWRFGQSFLVQHIEYLVFLQRFNAAEIEVISKDIGSNHRPIWGQRELGNLLIAKRGKWNIKDQKTIQRERQR